MKKVKSIENLIYELKQFWEKMGQNILSVANKRNKKIGTDGKKLFFNHK